MAHVNASNLLWIIPSLMGQPFYVGRERHLVTVAWFVRSNLMQLYRYIIRAVAKQGFLTGSAKTIRGPSGTRLLLSLSPGRHAQKALNLHVGCVYLKPGEPIGIKDN